MSFKNRRDAGRKLADALGSFRGEDIVVLGLPRGGVEVAYDVAAGLGAPLDVVLVRKLGLPSQPELAMGAIGEDGVRVLNEEVVRRSRVSTETVEAVARAETAELEQRAVQLRSGRPREPLRGRTAIVVDDGVATGATARAACEVVRAQGAARVVLAVPIGSRRTLTDLEQVADEVVCLEQPRWFMAVGQGYLDFSQVSLETVRELLRASTAPPSGDG